jgi:hypothetical protein
MMFMRISKALSPVTKLDITLVRPIVKRAKALKEVYFIPKVMIGRQLRKASPEV